MLNKFLVLLTAASLLMFGTPSYASGYDFGITAYATANTTTIPSVITWHINVASVGINLGDGKAQTGDVEFDASASISLVISNDCDTIGNHVTCHWSVQDGVENNFEVHGLVALIAAGEITVVPTFTSSTPRSDDNPDDNSATLTCTAVTSALVVC